MTEYVAIDRVVGLHFTLTDAAGEVLDASDDGQPMHYLHGHGNLVPGLEAALTGAEVGSKHTIVVAPADGYGEATVEPQPIPREHFPPFIPLEPGLQLSTRTEDGALVPIWVTDVNDDEIFVTSDHPLAGVELHFDVEVVDIRDATASELDQGRVGCSCC